MNTATIEVWILVDENGEAAVGLDPEAMATSYAENVGALEDVATRRVQVTLTVSLPTTVQLTATVPAEGDATLAIAG